MSKPTNTIEQVTIHTDGACIGNPGPGGYGIVIQRGKARREISGGFRMTTNNRMELMACIVALRSLKAPSTVKLFSDSRYVVDAINKKWAYTWRSNRWKRDKNKKAENADLWAELLNLCDQHQVRFVWVKGHAGNPFNERCDALSNQFAKKKNLPTDTFYENQRTSQQISLF